MIQISIQNYFIFLPFNVSCPLSCSLFCGLTFDPAFTSYLKKLWHLHILLCRLPSVPLWFFQGCVAVEQTVWAVISFDGPRAETSGHITAEPNQPIDLAWVTWARLAWCTSSAPGYPHLDTPPPTLTHTPLTQHLESYFTLVARLPWRPLVPFLLSKCFFQSS